MRPLGTVLKVCAIVVAIVGLGVLIGQFGARQDPVALEKTSPTSALPASEAEGDNRSAFFKKYAQTPAADSETELASTNVLVTATNGMADWEDKIDQVLGSDADVADMAKKLLELFPKFPEAGQIEAAQHLSNLLDDEDYAPMGQYLTNANTPASVLTVLMNDAYNRPDSLKLPLFLEVARNPNHPHASEAKEDLEFYLDEDYGEDWKVWEQKLQEWLKENPD